MLGSIVLALLLAGMVEGFAFMLHALINADAPVDIVGDIVIGALASFVIFMMVQESAGLAPACLTAGIHFAAIALCVRSYYKPEAVR